MNFSGSTGTTFTLITGGPGPTGGVNIATTTITPSATGTYLLASASCEFSNSDSTSDYSVSVYMVVDGLTSSLTNSAITRKSGGGSSLNGYISLTISQISNQITSLGPYTVQVYAYVTPSTTSVVGRHTDLWVLGNLSLRP
jgi:hypothetical protein